MILRLPLSMLGKHQIGQHGFNRLCRGSYAVYCFKGEPKIAGVPLGLRGGGGLNNRHSHHMEIARCWATHRLPPSPELMALFTAGRHPSEMMASITSSGILTARP